MVLEGLRMAVAHKGKRFLSHSSPSVATKSSQGAKTRRSDTDGITASAIRNDMNLILFTSVGLNISGFHGPGGITCEIACY